MRAVSVGSGVVASGANGKREPVCGASKIREGAGGADLPPREVLLLLRVHPRVLLAALALAPHPQLRVARARHLAAVEHLSSGGGEASAEWAGRCVRLRRIVCVRERPRRTAHPSAAVYAEPAETREALSSGSAFGVCRLAWSRWPRRPYPPLPHV